MHEMNVLFLLQYYLLMESIESLEYGLKARTMISISA